MEESMDKNQTRKRLPNPAARCLAGLLVVMYIVQLAVSRAIGEDILYQQLAKWGEGIRTGEWWRLITYAIMHGSLLHLFLNAVSIFIVGTWMEMYEPGWKVVAVFVAGVFGGGMASYFLTPAPMIGASPGAYGMFGAWLVYLMRFGERWKKLLWAATIICEIMISLGPGLDFY